MTNFFICCTPYHIVNTIFLLKGYYSKDNNILFLCNHFVNAEKIVQSLKNEALFSAVYFIKDENLRSKNFKKLTEKLKLLNLYISKHSIEKYCSISEQPDQVIFYSFTLFNTLLLTYCKKKNSNVKFYIGEDGNRDYIYQDFGVNTTKLFKIIRFLSKLNNHEIIFIPDKYIRFLYCPNLIEKKNTDIKILPIIKNEKNYAIGRDVLNRIFEFNDDMNIKDKYIFFESVLEENMELQNKIIKSFRIFTRAFILKTHPRSDINYVGMKQYKHYHVPWEIICMNSDMKNRVLISVNSNACLTPKIMFGKEPELIFLYKLVYKNEKLNEIENFMQHFFDLYADKTKLYIPNTIEEFNDLIRLFKTNNDGESQ